MSDILTVALLKGGSPDDNPATTTTTIHNNKEEGQQQLRRDGHHNDTASEATVLKPSPSGNSDGNPSLNTKTKSNLRGRFFNNLGGRIRSRSVSLRTTMFTSPSPSSPVEEKVKRRKKEKDGNPSFLSRLPFFSMSSTKNKNMDKGDSTKEMKKETQVEIQSVGTVVKPLMNFRGGPQWLSISRDAQIVSIDVFSGRVPRPPLPLSIPNSAHSHSGHTGQTGGGATAAPSGLARVLPLNELNPLTEFRHLRVLKITGMMRTYQKYIWETVWRNPELTDLWLEMALKPEITLPRDTRARCCRPAQDWPVICPDWNMGEAGGGCIVDGAHMYQ